MTRPLFVAVLASVLLTSAACTSTAPRSHARTRSGQIGTASSVASSSSSLGGPITGLAGMPPLQNPRDVYAADRPGMLSPAVASDPAYVYVPNTISNNVYVIDQHTMRVVRVFAAGNEPQHVVPAYDLKTLYVTSDKPGVGSLTAISPRTGKPAKQIPVDDAYNMYFTPDGQFAVVVQEAYKRLAFYNPHTWVLHDSLTITSCAGIDHLDFTADGTKLLVSCEFADRVAVVDVAGHKLIGTVPLPGSRNGMPQDVKLSPDGTVFYVADMTVGGVYVIDATTFRVIHFQPTGKGAHGLYVSRDSKRMFVTNRDEGSISVIDLTTRRPQVKWLLPGGGSPDMGNISADGKVLWLSGRYNKMVYAINAATGHLIAKIPVGEGPHGLCVWPLPGRYSLGHTGILR